MHPVLRAAFREHMVENAERLLGQANRRLVLRHSLFPHAAKKNAAPFIKLGQDWLKVAKDKGTSDGEAIDHTAKIAQCVGDAAVAYFTEMDQSGDPTTALKPIEEDIKILGTKGIDIKYEGGEEIPRMIEASFRVLHFVAPPWGRF